MRTEHITIYNTDLESDTKMKKPMGIIALRYDNSQVHLGASWCNPKDNFNKKLGTIKAIGRTKEKDHLTSDLKPQELIDVLSVNFDAHSSRVKNFAEVFCKKCLEPK